MAPRHPTDRVRERGTHTSRGHATRADQNRSRSMDQPATSTVESLDPLNTPPRLPDIPNPRADDLKPFLGHWSPYGPTY